MWPGRFRRMGTVFLVLLAMRVPMDAQTIKLDDPKDGKDPLTELDFWKLNQGLTVQLAAHMVGAGNAHGAAGARMLATSDELPMTDWRFVFDEPLPLSFRQLERIEDNRFLPQVFRNQLVGPELAWFEIFKEALRRSNESDLAMFKKAAEEHKRVAYHNLKNTPAQYRGKIITISGKITQIREEKRPRGVGPEIPKIYTSYIIGPTPNAPPFAAAYTEFPDGLTEDETNNLEKLNLEVTFRGYFISLVRFPLDKPTKAQADMIAPYLIGKTLIIHRDKQAVAPPVEAPTSYAYYLIVTVVGAFVVIALGLAGLNVWLRRGDSKVQAKLAQMRAKQNPFNVEPAEPETPGTEEK